MIISDTHRFAFLHIPKTAGMSVRAALSTHDSYGGRFFGIRKHPALGTLDMSHLPLSVLRQSFRDEFEKVRSYFSFVVVRDPQQRFPSSLKQRLQLYRGWEGSSSLGRLPPRDILVEAYAVIEYLDAHREIDDPSMIHFTRQTDFVFEGGRRIVTEAFAIETVAADLRDLFRRRYGLAVSMPHWNVTTRYRSRLMASVVERARGAGRYLPAALRKPASRALGRYRAPGNPLAEVLASRDDIRRFVDAYYAEDRLLHAQASGGRNAGRDEEQPVRRRA